MSMHGKNDRSVHSDHRKIANNLRRHAELAAVYAAQGADKERASKLAYDVMRGKITDAAARAAIAKAEQE